MPVLLEDVHEDVHAWKPVTNIPDPNASTAPPKDGFTTKLTLVVTLIICLGLVALNGPMLVRKARILYYSSRNPVAARAKGATGKTGAAKSKSKTPAKGMRRQASEESQALNPADDEEEGEEDDEEEEEDEDADDDEEEDPTEVFKSKYKVGSEARAVNLKEKKYLQHNKKLGVIKKVDAAAGKVYIEMKASGSKLVLKGENVEPVSHAKGRGGRAV